jgi:hypothetical protein
MHKFAHNSPAPLFPHLADVKASGQHISADEDLGLTPPELSHHSVTVIELHITLQETQQKQFPHSDSMATQCGNSTPDC